MTLTQINKAGLDEIALDHVFTIGASGTSAYTFQGEGLNGTVNNPTLYLTRGKTYRFENGTGGHPIRIQSADDGINGTLYNTGVTGNNSAGTVIVEVQHDAPDVLYYQCASHASMKGILYITGALADQGVTTAKLANGAVTAAKIGDGEVSTAKLANFAVTTGKMASGSVNSTVLAAGSVLTDGIADQAVTLAKLPHGTSSNDGKFLRANNGADPTFESVDTTNIANGTSNVTVANNSSVSTTVAGSQRLSVTTNSTEVADVLTVSGTDPRIDLVDSNHNPDFSIYGNGGVFTISDVTNTVDRFEIQADGTVDIAGNLDANGGLDVTGNITCTGTIPASQLTGALPAIDGSNLTGVSAGGASNISFNSGNGIDFSATADGTGSSNRSELFDDYEEGTWTGAIETGSANINNEWYIKTGGYVVGGGSITAIGNISSSNAIRVTGLPFSSSGGGSAPGAIAGSKISVMDRACMSTVSGSSIYFLQSSTSTGSWDYIKHQHVLQSSGSLTFSFHYYCTS